MKTVGIICGGFSSEFEVSMKSARNIRNNFPEGYIVYLIVLDRAGWHVLDNDEKLQFDQTDFTFEKNSEKVKIDLAIVYIHGDPGENGKVQAYLEMIGLPYLNSGPLASELSFDKWYCNQFLKGFGYKVADSIYLASEKVKFDRQEAINKLGLPIFVKPCDSGSSFGIAKVNEENQLEAAVEAAFKEGRSVVLEAFLDGREITCGVYRNKQGVQALPLTEIIAEGEFFDYDAKYLGKSREVTPAEIPSEVASKVQEAARGIYQLLQLRSVARIDFMIVNNEPFVIEVNTTPGFSDASIVPQMIRESGNDVTQFWKEILEVEL